MRRALFITTAAALSAAGVLIILAVRDLDRPFDRSRAVYVTSERCLSCHPAFYASWHDTFHRTMTQLPSERSVQGDFSGATLVHDGVVSRFFREGGAYVIETLDVDGTMRRFPVAMTVWSRRVQQYVTKLEDRHVRLPLAWNIEEKRWFHLSGGFLHPDGADFNQHRATWDSNCIFCHNVKARPGYDYATRRFSPTVAELGVACEACHGPGSEHVRRNANPLRRYLLHYSDRADPTIVHPARLPKEQRLQVCGHCHGQRLPSPPERIEQFATGGDPYTPGDDLDRWTAPIWRDTKLAGVDLSLRFWNDGTPRLTAYEYQGLLQSLDYQRGDLTCLSCHTMHGGDRRGMIAPRMRTEEACLPCHRDLAADHSRHESVDCYACHMPPITYGVLAVHPTHRITRPDPSRAWRYDMPEACTLCHTNRTAEWAARNWAAMWGEGVPADLPAHEVAENIRALLAGDAVQRAVAVMALAAERSYSSDAAARLWAVPFFLVTMEDEYPAVRHFAARALRQVIARASKASPHLVSETAELPHFDPLAPLEARRAMLERWRDWWARTDKSGIAHPGAAVPLDAALQPVMSTIDRLRGEQVRKVISIGE